MDDAGQVFMFMTTMGRQGLIWFHKTHFIIIFKKKIFVYNYQNQSNISKTINNDFFHWFIFILNFRVRFGSFYQLCHAQGIYKTRKVKGFLVISYHFILVTYCSAQNTTQNASVLGLLQAYCVWAFMLLWRNAFFLLQILKWNVIGGAAATKNYWETSS